MPEGVSPRKSLVGWANKQDNWVKSLVGHVLTTTGSVGEPEGEKLADEFLAEKGLSDAKVTPVPNLGSDQGAAITADPIRLVSIRNCKGVNALDGHQVMEFHPQLTVIFGENGAGKSGYVRLLKRLAKVRAAETILGNVFKKGIDSREAEVRYAVGEVEGTIPWKGEEGVEPLTEMCVFDGRAVPMHVAGDLTFVYTPLELAYFKFVSESIRAVRESLKKRLADGRPGVNTFLPAFVKGAPIYALIESLGPKTDLKSLVELGTLDGTEATVIDSLRTTIDTLNAGDAVAAAERVKNRLSVVNHLSELVNAVVVFDSSEWMAATDEVRVANEAVENEATGFMPTEELLDDARQAWRQVIQDAEDFLERSGHEHYPEQGDVCIYCQQPLDSTARERVASYRAFLKGIASERLRAAKARVKVSLESLQTDRVSEAIAALPALLKAIEGNDEPLWVVPGKQVLDAMPELKLTAAAIGAASSIFTEELTASASLLAPQLDAVKVELTNTLSASTGTEEDRKRTLKEAQEKLLLLEQRQVLAGHLERIQVYVTAAIWAKNLEREIGTITGLLTSLTHASTAASEDVIKKNFAAAFEGERQHLDAPMVQLSFPGKKGETTREKTIGTRVPKNVSIKDILSEGEQKALALADFLAEASLRSRSAPVVFDDPVSSLDHRRSELIAKRIVGLSAFHQVIVFTHDAWFIAELEAAMKPDGIRCYFRQVVADDGKIGMVMPLTHPRIDTPGPIAHEIDQLLIQLKDASGLDRQEKLNAVYRRIRTWCEAVVERELLGSVSMRYRANISIDRLTTIRPDRLQEAINTIVEIYHKASSYIDAHAQSLSAAGIQPTLDEANKHWRELKAARTAYKAK